MCWCLRYLYLNPRNSTFLLFGFCFALQVVPISYVLAGQYGVLSNRHMDSEITKLVACYKELPRPIYSGVGKYTNLPWITGNEFPYHFLPAFQHDQFYQRDGETYFEQVNDP